MSTDSKGNHSFLKETPFETVLQHFVTVILHGKYGEDKIKSFIANLPITEFECFESYIDELVINKVFTFKKLFLDNKKEKTRSLFDFFIASSISDLLLFADKQITSYFKNILYVEPIRARAQRYYRNQGLSIDELDPSGENTAMFLSNMKRYEQEEFKAWCLEHFDLYIEAKSQHGHVSLKLYESSNLKVGKNLADLGFGFSQILPIIVQLWSVKRAPSKRLGMLNKQTTKKVVIEQPELHLHPSYRKN